MSPLNTEEHKDLSYIINLQTFKHELKTTLSQEELLEHLFGFKFVLNLSEHQQKREAQALQRDPQKYFDYLETIH